MTQARSTLVSVEDTPYYHLVTRCVRRTFLCGVDKTSGKSYEHRRQWIEDRIRVLSSLFAIDLCAYAVMSNHIHIIAKLCPEQAEKWSTDETLQRWTSLFKGPSLVQKYLKGDDLLVIEQQMIEDTAEVYRKRLSSVSWFMKCLNEPIARAANKEDNCTGHFWESRFKSQALLSEEALLSCMAYVDLNPIRANMAATPETSDHTSIKERLTPNFDEENAVKRQITQQCLQETATNTLRIKPLAKFEGNVNQHDQLGILFSLKDYLELVEYTGRRLHPSKRGQIAEALPPILDRLNLDQQAWLEQAIQFKDHYPKKFAKPSARQLRMAS